MDSPISIPELENSSIYSTDCGSNISSPSPSSFGSKRKFCSGLNDDSVASKRRELSDTTADSSDNDISTCSSYSPLSLPVRVKCRNVSGSDLKAKKERRKHQNRVAAAKSRETKKAYVEDLEMKVEEMTSANSSAQAKIKFIERENAKLRKLIEKCSKKRLENVKFTNNINNELPTEPVINKSDLSNIHPSPTALSEFLLESSINPPEPINNPVIIFNADESIIPVLYSSSDNAVASVDLDFFDLSGISDVHDNACRLQMLFDVLEVIYSYFTRIILVILVQHQTTSLQWTISNFLLLIKLIQIQCLWKTQNNSYNNGFNSTINYFKLNSNLKHHSIMYNKSIIAS